MHKLGVAAVAYEIATCIMTGHIVAFNGPFLAGKWPDINMFWNRTKKYLLPEEICWGNLGHRDPKVITKLNAKTL